MWIWQSVFYILTDTFQQLTFSIFSIIHNFTLANLHVYHRVTQFTNGLINYSFSSPCHSIIAVCAFTVRGSRVACGRVARDLRGRRVRWGTRVGRGQGSGVRLVHHLRHGRWLKVRWLFRRCGRGPDVIKSRTWRVARRQRNPPDDWVRFKTPAWRTSCIMRSFSCRTANNHTSLIIVTTYAKGCGLCRGLRGTSFKYDALEVDLLMYL